MTLTVEALRISVGLDPLTLRLSGDLDMESAEALTRAFGLLPPGPLVVDVAELTFIDSSGIAALAVEARRRSLTVTGAEGVIERAIEITGFADWL